MPRPKTGRPPKRSLTLTINEVTRAELNFLSMHYNESISALVADWAARGARTIQQSEDQQPPTTIRVTRQKPGDTPFQNLNISVSEETRAELNFISSHLCTSISALVSAWAAQEASALCAHANEASTDNKEA